MSKIKKSMVWRLLDARIPLTPGSEYPTTIIFDAPTLDTKLRHYTLSNPGIFILKNPNGDMLWIGLGGPLGIVEWMTPPYTTPKVAYAENPQTQNLVEFEMEGSGSAILFQPSSTC